MPEDSGLDITELATGLQFPEGPVVMPDGSIVVTEIKSGTLARVQPDGSVDGPARPRDRQRHP